MNMDFGRFHGRNISIINIWLSSYYWDILAGTVTDATAKSVYEPAISVTHGDYFGRTANHPRSLTPSPGNFGSCRAAVIAHLPQFAAPQLVVPGPAALELNEQIQISAEGNLAPISNLPVAGPIGRTPT